MDLPSSYGPAHGVRWDDKGRRSASERKSFAARMKAMWEEWDQKHPELLEPLSEADDEE
jgi:hypothetical protein